MKCAFKRWTPRAASRGAAAGLLAVAAGAAAGAAGVAATGTAAAATSICTAASSSHAALAARLSRDIVHALAGRADTYSVTVADRRTGIVCRLDEGHRYDSASVVKATILAALLRWHQETGRRLTQNEVHLATLMITQSDNNAASALWAEAGRARLQHLLNLARMTETQLGPGGYWGLTQITARDELTLLRLLTKSNSVLNSASRSFELGLMARVVSWQRWGTPAGAPRAVTVHVKNGWLPRATRGWRIHSIGAFTGKGRDYMIAVLTDNNPSMAYGVTTIEDVAVVIHRDLNAGLPAAVGRTALTPAQQVPDERLPALPAIP
ncbi:MAG: serine hydrolase [Streptosporangiaceae bacterium]|nr:serine hydrolase [Streptosporangiaceae bacterium]MBV9854321.1 serine hydrolase [Streptosporangiaceae bacterium]